MTRYATELTAARLREVLDYNPETGVFTRRIRTSCRIKVGDVCNCRNDQGYVLISVGNRRYHAHRLAWLYVHGEWPSGYIDHINHVTSDNRIANLRDGTQSDNMGNQVKAARNNRSSGLLGVSWYRRYGRWQAQIHINNKCRHLGYYNTPQEAHAAYLEAKATLHKFSTLTAGDEL